jgi:hypothetical protein
MLFFGRVSSEGIAHFLVIHGEKVITPNHKLLTIEINLYNSKPMTITSHVPMYHTVENKTQRPMKRKVKLKLRRMECGSR